MKYLMKKVTRGSRDKFLRLFILLESHPGHLLSWLRFVEVFSVSGQILGQCLTLDHESMLSYPFQSIIHYRLLIQHYIAWAIECRYKQIRNKGISCFHLQGLFPVYRIYWSWLVSISSPPPSLSPSRGFELPSYHPHNVTDCKSYVLQPWWWKQHDSPARLHFTSKRTTIWRR
jgi:hypothetical protein